jgi:hypothetical protein
LARWRRALPFLLAGALGALLALPGCGTEEVGADAVVTAYVAAPLCAEAKRELAREGGRGGEVGVRVLCLAEPRGDGRLDLAVVGASARRATEDSTAVGFLEPPGPANRFARPIVESAGIAYLLGDSGVEGMGRLLLAIEEAGGERAKVAAELEAAT